MEYLHIADSESLKLVLRKAHSVVMQALMYSSLLKYLITLRIILLC